MPEDEFEKWRLHEFEAVWPYTSPQSGHITAILSDYVYLKSRGGDVWPIAKETFWDYYHHTSNCRECNRTKNPIAA